MSDSIQEVLSRRSAFGLAIKRKIRWGRPDWQQRRHVPRRRPSGRVSLRRVLIATAVAVVVLVGGVAASGYFYVNHELSSIHRISGITALTAADQPVMPTAYRKSMTVLLIGSHYLPYVREGGGRLGSSTAPQGLSGLIALVHLNANQHGGAVVSIPPNAVVTVPGFGRRQLWKTLGLGGPSLLIRTVERLTKVRIDHYSVLDFMGVRDIVAALHGVKVIVPQAFTNGGYYFPKGVNYLTSASVLPYVRQPQVSEIGRILLQSNLIRAILTKIARQNLFQHPTVDYALINAMSSALSVDSNFTNAEIARLALRLGHLNSRDGVFVSAPTINGSPYTGGIGSVYLNRRVSNALWQAIRHDSVAAFARRYPYTVTPIAPV